MSPALGSSVITEKHASCVICFGDVGKQIEKRIHIQQEVSRIARLRSYHVWALDWIPTEKDWEIEANQVIVSLLSVELDSEASRIAGLVRKLATECNCAKPDESRCFLADRAEEAGFLRSIWVSKMHEAGDLSCDMLQQGCSMHSRNRNLLTVKSVTS